MRILLVEDDTALAALLCESLTSQYYVVERAEDGQMGWEYTQSTAYDLIVIDVDLPKINGITLCQQIRSHHCATPILLITASSATTERIRGLDAGADDYLSKPLDLDELHARVRALLRRTDASRSPILEVGDLRLDPSRCQVTYSEQSLNLTPKEYSLLELFLRNPARVFSRGNIIEHLWTFDDPPQEESVKSHIKGLRQKLKAVGAVDWIENVYGLGYRLKQGIDESKQTAIAPSPSGSGVPAVSPSTEKQFSQAVDGLWQRYERLMAQRLAVLQQAATAIRAGTLSTDLRQSAAREAHKLAGVLGMFEREAGSAIAHDIEHLLTGSETLLPTQQERLVSLTQDLEQVLRFTESASPVVAEPSVAIASFTPSQDALPVASVKALVVDDDPAFLDTLRPMLAPWGIQMTGLANPREFWSVLASVSPDFLILDVEMPDISGIELCQAIRADSRWWGLPILFLTAHRDIDTIQQVLAAGADDYVVKPVVGAELLTRITNRLERTRWLQTLSTKDPLTGLTNQPQSSRDLEQFIQQMGDRQPLCLVLVSVTELPHINLQYGHIAGNQVLQRCGQLLQSGFYDHHGLGYWGNGEFVMGISNSSPTDVGDRLSSLLNTLHQQLFSSPDGEFQTVCHWSTAHYPSDGLTVRSLYQTARQRLVALQQPLSLS